MPTPSRARRKQIVAPALLPTPGFLGGAEPSFAALSFAIIQFYQNGDVKLRRGEDLRRSGHNATVKAHDVATHHFLGDLIRRVRADGWDQVVFGHDPQNAYCQW